MKCVRCRFGYCMDPGQKIVRLRFINILVSDPPERGSAPASRDCAQGTYTKSRWSAYSVPWPRLGGNIRTRSSTVPFNPPTIELVARRGVALHRPSSNVVQTKPNPFGISMLSNLVGRFQVLCGRATSTKGFPYYVQIPRPNILHK
jgi:hypothetical protein